MRTLSSFIYKHVSEHQLSLLMPLFDLLNKLIAENIQVTWMSYDLLMNGENFSVSASKATLSALAVAVAR